MDDRRFDALVRKLASASNRRQVLKGFLGLGGAAVATSLHGAEAARRPTPTPKPISCPGEQTWNGVECACPNGKSNCGPDCCPDGIAECCNNACCFGNCYGQELCCPEGFLFCDGSCRDWGCCADDDCSGNAACDPLTHTCQCVADCVGKSCGNDGCGGSCGTCPGGQTCQDGACGCPSGVLCSDNACHTCCAATDCAETYGGDAECWKCIEGACGYYSGFCSGGVCGTSSDARIGHCLECGMAGPLGSDACNQTVGCCSGHYCDFVFGDQGLCRVAA